MMVSIELKKNGKFHMEPQKTMNIQAYPGPKDQMLASNPIKERFIIPNNSTPTVATVDIIFLTGLHGSIQDSE